ncbi:EAL domain-containing protein [Streptomyces sp. SS52]|nr:EAL domain-containing protein [Streptomyces sp. SS52]
MRGRVVGDGDAPLRLLTDLAPELVKLDASLLARPAAVRAMRVLCDELGALLAVEGVETEAQYAAARTAGAQWAQGELLAPPARLPATDVYLPAGSPAYRRRRGRVRRCVSSCGRPRCCRRPRRRGRCGRC